METYFIINSDQDFPTVLKEDSFPLSHANENLSSHRGEVLEFNWKDSLRMAAFYPTISGFQTSHTFPTRSGPGLRVSLPGSHPAGVASAPLVARTCWKA
jgi:hypothetical protein